MARDRDSPVEWTGEAHLVSRTCKTCGESFSQPETSAEYQSENDIPPICGDCHERVEDLWSDLYIRDQVQRLLLMANYLEAYGYDSKAQSLRVFADSMDAYESVIRAVESCDAMSDYYQFEREIERYDEA